MGGCVSGTGGTGKRQCGPERASGTEHGTGGEELATGLVVAVLGHGVLRLVRQRAGATAEHAGWCRDKAWMDVRWVVEG
ncbi:hypothetical protein DW66_5674 [Pseudomonas putida]|nr:hypothetical protein DW66_5554 [Pseudomonas putida]AHZ80170.1 hypothetical protein DW66_5674 [Pseudomonas putida]AJG16392.1 hypothetical protein RK21_04884 [Pseudomonas plecoglossicida]